MASETGASDRRSLPLAARVEGLLFVSGGAITIGDLASALQEHPRQIEQALDVLAHDCLQRGICLQRHGRSVQLTSAPELAGDIERLLGLETTARLTRAALEVLAIVAYQQPVTRPHIDSVRGVNSDSVLRTLLRLGLIDEAGRSGGPGRPILYVTTPVFLQHFGLASMDDLPPLGLTHLDQPENAPESPEPGSQGRGAE